MSSAQDLITAKERLTIEEAWIGLGIPGAPKRGLNQSPFRVDKTPSFSIHAGGRRWKDFGTGEGGSVVDFIMKATGSSVGDAIRTALRMAGVGAGMPTPPPLAYVPEPRPEPEPFVNRWETVADAWNEGGEWIQANPRIQARLAEWRGWPAEWVKFLSQHNYISCPKAWPNGEERGIAFQVHEYQFEENGFSTPAAAFHIRLKDGGWEYRPKKVPATPFTIGNVCVNRLLVAEGQWDAITLAGAAGVFDEDPQSKLSVLWHTAVVGIRGAPGYGNFLSILEQRNKFTGNKPEVFLFRDNDKAGETWRDKFAPRLAELAAVRLFRPVEGKDINEIHKADPLTLADVEQTLGAKS